MAAPEQFPIVPHGDGVLTSSYSAQPWQPTFCCEGARVPVGRLFCPRTTRAAVLETNDKEKSLRSIVRVVFLKKHPSLCPAWRFWSRGEPSGRRRVPKQTRVGAPKTTFCQEHHKPSSATRDSTRTHSVPQPAATSFGKSLPLPAFLLLSLRDALRYQAWRGCQRTSGLAHARPPHGCPQPPRG